MRQAAALVRALAATAGEAALSRALPAYAGLAVGIGLLFGGNGLETTTVIAGADADPLARLFLWTAWLLLAAPAVDAVWRTPASFWLRSLPVPRAWHLAVLLAFTLLAELPWWLLWHLGGGVVAGLAALGGALAIHALLLARPPGLPGLALVALALTLALFTPPLVLSLATWPIAPLAFRRAWLNAPAHGGRPPRSLVAGPAPVALALAHLAGLVRGHRPLLLRAALVVGLAAAAAWLAARNNALTDLTARLEYAAGFLAVPVLLAGTAASTPLLAAESRAAWLLADAPARTRLAAHALAAALLGAALATPAALALARAWDLTPADGLRLLLALALAAAALATQAALLTRWAARFGTRGPGRQLLALLLAVILALALLATLGPSALLAWLALALLTWRLGHVLSARSSPRSGAAPVLTITAVRKRLGTRLVLDAIDLACPPGTVALVLGENGAGKSTLLRIAAGILEPDAGTVTVAGNTLTSVDRRDPASPAALTSSADTRATLTSSDARAASRDPRADLGSGLTAPHHALLADLPAALAARRALGYAPDTADAFPDLSVRELVALVAALKRAPLPPDALRDRLGLVTVWRQRLRTLSFGQVKRTYLLAALVGDPAVLILDEPSNGLDPDGARTVADLLRERAAAGRSALVATNDAAFAARLGGDVHHLHAARLSRAPLTSLTTTPLA